MNIGLIAMSGIRVVDQKLLELGLTLPGFVERSKVIASLPSLGLLTLAGMTPEEHEVEYIEIEDIKKLDELPDKWDLVGISSYSAQIDEAYELGDRYLEAGTPVVIGGPHVSALPEEAGEHCTSVVIGEGELSWLELLEDLESGSLKDTYGRVGDGFDLNKSPMPEFELLDISKYDRLTVQASRGCPHRCQFCASSPILTRKYRQKPVDRVLEEIDRIIEIWENPFIEFADDNAIVNKKYWKKLLTRLKERNVKWFVETDISLSKDEKLLELMRESGCAQVLIGLESPVASGLDNLEIESNWKLKKLPHYKEAIKKIQSKGIRVTGCFVLGLDGQTTDIFDEIDKFVRETEMFDVQITIQTPFPGTPLYKRLKKEGRLLEEKNWNKCTLFDVNFKPNRMSIKELEEGFRELGVKLYSDEYTKWRKNRFREKLKRVIKKERGKNEKI